ncbi:fimbrial biogenesis chaperone [Pseudomonas frederiksbergensis]|uniref:fimbrial biogenesis chaperone n=1 Tax=Pseudomonas frederiksbergensis TaxID=104087 RepID=UPI003D06C9E4
MLTKWVIGLAAAVWIFSIDNAQASISLSGTRVIFNGEHKEANITVRNGAGDVLIQSWIDNGTDDNATVPFVVTPSLARLPANQQQLLRVLYEGKGLPTDRESVLWLNVQEIPQASGRENVLQLAVRQRVKVFFRPAGLPAQASLASGVVQWQLLTVNGKSVLRAHNPSRFHVSMSEVDLSANGRRERVKDTAMLAPLEQVDWELKDFTAQQPPSLSFHSINDYGGQNRYQVQLEQGRTLNATAAEKP